MLLLLLLLLLLLRLPLMTITTTMTTTATATHQRGRFQHLDDVLHSLSGDSRHVESYSSSSSRQTQNSS